MSSVPKSVVELCNAVKCTISCDYCDNELNSFQDIIDTAESAHEEGWEVNKSGKVKCPECVDKMKRK